MKPGRKLKRAVPLRALPLIAALITVLLPAWGQNGPVHVTVDEAVAAALSNNRDIKIATLEGTVAGARYKETEASFLPRIGLSYAAMTTNNPLNAFGFKLQQKDIGAEDFDPARLDHPAATPDFMATFDLQQPLINMDQLYQRKSARAIAESYCLKGQRTREGVVFEVRKAYLQLQLAHRAQKVMEEALATALALYRYTQDRVDQGLLSKAEALNTQVQVRTSEGNLATARSQVGNASDYLGLLMGRSPGPVYSVDTATGAMTPADTLLPNDRADLLALRKGIEASDLRLRSSKWSALPRLNAFGSYQLNDSRMLGFGAGAYLAGIRLSMDLFGGNSIRNRNATLSLEKTKLLEEYTLYKEKSRVELAAARRKLDDAAYRIELQKAAVVSSTESYRILRDRYEQGLTGSTDVLLAQTQLAQQRLALADALFTRDITSAYIEFLTTSSGK